MMADLKLIQQAHDYFDSLGLADGGTADPTIQDSDGLISYVVVSTNPPPTEIKELYNEIASVMEGLTNVVTSAVLKLAGTDAAKKHNPDTWKGPLQAMVKAFCAGFSEEEKSFNQQVLGVEVATKFLEILAGAVASEGAAFLSFTKYLQSQGESMRLNASSSGAGYLYASVSIAHEIFQASDGTWIYTPKFKSYFTQFTENTFKLTTSCASAEYYDFNFDLNVMTGGFMVESWKSDPEFRKQVKDFIKKFQKVNIKDSENYFDGIFASNSEAVPIEG